MEGAVEEIGRERKNAAPSWKAEGKSGVPPPEAAHTVPTWRCPGGRVLLGDRELLADSSKGGTGATAPLLPVPDYFPDDFVCSSPSPTRRWPQSGGNARGGPIAQADAGVGLRVTPAQRADNRPQTFESSRSPTSCGSCRNTPESSSLPHPRASSSRRPAGRALVDRRVEVSETATRSTT